MLRGCIRLTTALKHNMSKRFKHEKILTSVSNSKVNQESNLHTDNMNDISSSRVTRLNTPIKSDNDKKSYSVIRLENGLTALLVSDVMSCGPDAPDSQSSTDGQGAFESQVAADKEVVSDKEQSDADSTEESDNESASLFSEPERNQPKKDEKLAACSLTVGVGSFSDPQDIPGLAHFLEHMVFMGSKKFPKENEFDSFIKNRGGSDNASTECEYTTFYFECQVKYLPQAMDIFSQFFIDPLMKREAMTREREAVDSEFKIALPSDVFRRQQLLSSTAHSTNPGGKFLWGNIKTLQESVTDDYLYESVHKFRERHYSAHRMTLAVQAREPMQTLENLVVKCFSKIQNNDLPPENYNLTDKPFQTDKFSKIYFVESIVNNNLLELTWCMPSVKYSYKTKPTNYLSWAIGHEGKGSLMSFLRKKLWAVGLTAGHNDDGLASNSLYSLFTISIVLTEDGITNLENVFTAIFSYIKMIKNHGPDRRIFLELQQIAEIDFKYDEESPAVENVEFLSDNMQIYPPEDYMRGSEIHFEYNPEEIAKYLSKLDPSSVNIIIARKTHDPEIVLDKTEPWFKTKYTYQDIPEKWIMAWNEIEEYKEFHVPEPNPFITSDFTILHSDKDGLGSPYPEKIFSTEALDIWYKADRKFRLPLAFVGFQIINKNSFESVIENTMLSLYTEMLHYLLVEELYPANMALLEYNIVNTVDQFLSIEVYGFNEKLNVPLEKISKCILNFSKEITEVLLNSIKETNKKFYYNYNLKMSNLSREARMSILLNSHITHADKYNVLSSITLDMMKKFSNEFFSKVYIQTLVQGNITKEQALKLCTNFVEELNISALPKEERPKVLVHQLPDTERCCRLSSFNLSDSNCITTSYYQMGPGGVRDYCTIDLLMMLLEEPLFDTLRTQEQLGYDVGCSMRDTFGILGFTVSVMSQIYKHSVDHVEQRISEFLVGSVATLREMPPSHFDEVHQAIIKIKKICDLHIKEEIKRNWTEIKSFEYAFDRLDREIQCLLPLTPNDIIEFLESKVNPQNPNFKKLIVQVVGHHSKMEENEITDSKSNLPPTLNYKYISEVPGKPENYLIKDINEFRSQLPLYPENKVFAS